MCIVVMMLTGSTYAQLVGQPAPAIKFEHTFQGPPPGEITWEKLRGKVVVLEFWATWCTPCLGAVPHLNALVEELADAPVCFLMVTSEEPALIQKFLKKRKMSGWITLDTDKSVIRGFDAMGLPRTLVVDQSGIVVLDLDARPEDLTAELLRQIVNGTYKPKAEVPETKDSSTLPRLGAFTGGIDPIWMPWVEAGQIKVDFYYQTLIRPAVIPDGAGNALRSGGGAVGITIVGQSTLEVLRLALQLPSSARVVYEVELDTTKRWDVVFSRPTGWDLDRAWKEIAQAMCELVDVKTETFQDEREVLVGHASGKRILRHEDIDWEQDPTVKSLQSVTHLLNRLEATSGMIVLPESDELSRRYVDTFGSGYWNLSEEDLRAWLTQQGVTVTREKRNVELVKVLPR